MYPSTISRARHSAHSTLASKSSLLEQVCIRARASGAALTTDRLSSRHTSPCARKAPLSCDHYIYWTAYIGAAWGKESFAGESNHSCSSIASVFPYTTTEQVPHQIPSTSKRFSPLIQPTAAMATAASASASSGLTWQQQEMLRSGSSSSSSRSQRKVTAASDQPSKSKPLEATAASSNGKRAGTPSESKCSNAAAKANNGGKANRQAAAPKKPLTKTNNNGTSHPQQGKNWQQMELEASKRVNDAYSNSRDAETFGGASPSQSHRSISGTSKRKNGSARSSEGRGAGSGGTMPMRIAEPHAAATPSTPDKAAYAGPTFHNSPPASALPQPSFMKRRDLSNASTSAPSPLSSGSYQAVGDTSSFSQ